MDTTKNQQLASLITNLTAFTKMLTDAFYSANDSACIYESYGRKYSAKTVVLKHLLDDNLAQLQTLQADENANKTCLIRVMKLMGEAIKAKYHNGETRTAVKNLQDSSTSVVKSFDLLAEAREYDLYHYTRIHSIRLDVAFNQTFLEYSRAVNHTQPTPITTLQIPVRKSPEEVTAILRAALQRDLAIAKKPKIVERPKVQETRQAAWGKHVALEFNFQSTATQPADPQR